MSRSLVALFLLGATGLAPASPEPRGISSEAGAPVRSEISHHASMWQAIEWTDLDGRTWRAEDLEGRVVLLDFWATWCPPCLAELPHLRQLQNRAAQDDRLVIVGIALDTIDRRRLRSFLRRQQIDWPQVHERRGSRGGLARRFGVEAVPATFLIDPDGRLVARDLRGEGLDAAIDALLNRRSPPAPRPDRP